MATHSSTLAWKIPWTEEPGMLQSMGSQRVGHDWATSHTSLTQLGVTRSLQLFLLWRLSGDRLAYKSWQETDMSLPKAWFPPLHRTRCPYNSLGRLSIANRDLTGRCLEEPSRKMGECEKRETSTSHLQKRLWESSLCKLLPWVLERQLQGQASLWHLVFIHTDGPWQ